MHGEQLVQRHADPFQYRAELAGDGVHLPAYFKREELGVDETDGDFKNAVEAAQRAQAETREPDGPESKQPCKGNRKPLNTNRHRDPRKTNSALGQTYWQHHARVTNGMQPKIMGHVSIDVLEGIEVFACDNPGSSVAQMYKEMLAGIGPDATAGDPQTVSQFSELYDSAYDAVFPTTRAYLEVRHEVDEISSSLSLSVFDFETLHAFDLEAHGNYILGTFRNELKSRLNKVKGIDDVTAFSQAFEIYGEIIAYLHLRERAHTERLAERKGKKTPDFKCTFPDGKTFFVEVKSLDVVDGKPKNLAMLDDGLDAEAELEEQIHAGESVASAITEIAPFRKAGETGTYDPHSLIRVIDTLREKSLQAFKAGQFAAVLIFCFKTPRTGLRRLSWSTQGYNNYVNASKDLLRIREKSTQILARWRLRCPADGRITRARPRLGAVAAVPRVLPRTGLSGTWLRNA